MSVFTDFYEGESSEPWRDDDGTFVDNVRVAPKEWGVKPLPEVDQSPTIFDPALVRASVLEETRRLADQAHDMLYRSVACLRVVDPVGAARYDRLLRDVADYADTMTGKI